MKCSHDDPSWCDASCIPPSLRFNPVHFSSAKQDWTTPRELFDVLNAEFNFGTDAAASRDNALCPAYFDEGMDALKPTACWVGSGAVFCNPPYGRTLGKWIAKASEEAAKGATVVMLIPARPDTKAWHEHILNRPNVEVRFLKGRLKFGGVKTPAPFPSAVVVFRP